MIEIGMLFRIKRNGKWDSVDICDMTDEEIDSELKDKSVQWLIEAIKIMARWIRDNVQEEAF